VAAVRHSLGFAEDSDAGVARIVGAVCSMGSDALDRRLLTQLLSQGMGNSGEESGRHDAP